MNDISDIESVAGTFLLNAAWQVALVVGVAALVERSWKRARAAARHQLWWAALILSVVLPGLSIARFSVSPAATLILPMSDAGTVGLLGASPIRPEVTIERSVLQWIIWAYAATVACRLLTIAWGLTGLRRLDRGTRPAAAPVAALARRFADRAGAGPVAVRIASGGAPMTYGCTPRIVLPRPLLVGTSPAVLESVLAHEVAHVRRADFLWGVVAEVLMSAIHLHPATRVLRSRLQATREQACDEVASALRGRRVYARALFEAARLSSSERHVPLALAMGRSPLEERFERLLSAKPEVRLGLRRLALGMGSLVLSTVVAGVVAPSVRAAVAAVPAVAGAMASAVSGEADGDDSTYRYTADGRRDPFLDVRQPRRPEVSGIIDGYRIEEVALRGIVTNGKRRVALLWAPDRRTYFVEAGQRLYDGTVRSIEPASVTFSRSTPGGEETVRALLDPAAGSR